MWALKQPSLDFASCWMKPLLVSLKVKRPVGVEVALSAHFHCPCRSAPARVSDSFYDRLSVVAKVATAKPFLL